MARKFASCTRKLTTIQNILYPGGDIDASWSPDTIDAIARVVGLPKQGRASVRRARPRRRR